MMIGSQPEGGRRSSRIVEEAGGGAGRGSLTSQALNGQNYEREL